MPLTCPPVLEDLLESHWSACYRLALALVGETNAAEDVTQEALLAAFESRDSFDVGRPVRPWLFGIVHKRAMKHHRSNKRRAAREERVARRELGGDATMVETAEQAGLVRQHLQQVKPEFRHALALRYLEDMSLAQVAVALGIPQGTVSSRIRRGLQALERSLQPVLGLSGAALLAALKLALGSAVAPPAPSADALARRTPQGRGAVDASPSRRSRRAATVAAVAALTGLTGLSLVPDGDAADPQLGRVTPSATVRLDPANAEPAPADVGQPSNGAPMGPVVGAQGAGALTGEAPAVRGRVSADTLRQAWVRRVDEAELALLLGPLFGGGDEARARRLLGREHFGWNVPADSTPIDADGSFSLALPPGEHLLAIGAHGCRTRLLPVTAPLAKRLTVELEWLFPAQLKLRVVDAEGLPYGAAYVALRSEAIASQVWVEGLDTWASGQPRGLKLTRAMSRRSLAPAPLDASGAASLEFPAGSYDLSLLFRAGTREGGSIAPYLSSSLRPAEREVVLAAGASIAWEAVFDWRDGAFNDHLARVDVEVVDAEGQPVEGAFVHVSEYGADTLVGLRERGSGGATWISGGDGRVRLFGLEESNEFYVNARHGDRWTGLGQVLRTGGPHGEGEPVRVIRVTLDRPFEVGRLRIDLRDAKTGDSPLSSGLALVSPSTIGFAAAWQVSLSPKDGQPSVDVSGWLLDDQGRLLIGDLPPGRWTVRVEQPSGPRQVSYLPAEFDATVTVGQDTLASVELRRGGAILGQVLVGDVPARSQGAGDVTLYDPSRDRSAGQASLDAEGRFAISGLDPDGRYVLIVGARDGVLPFSFRDLSPSESAQVFALPAEVGLDVRVVNELGEPVQGANVTWRLGYAYEGMAETDATGHARWQGRFYKQLQVSVWVDGYQHQELDVPPPSPTTLEVTLVPDPDSVIVSGRVIDGRGQPLSGVEVSLSGPTALTDAQGGFLLRTKPGESWLRLNKDGFVPHSERLPVPPEGVRDLTLSLKRGTRITGRITAPAERLRRLRVGCRVVLDSGPSKFSRFNFEETGQFSTRRALPECRVLVQVYDRDQQVVVIERELQLVAGEDVELDLRLDD